MARYEKQPQSFVAAAICMVIAAMGLFLSLNPSGTPDNFILGIAVALVMGAMGVGCVLNALGMLPDRRSGDDRQK